MGELVVLGRVGGESCSMQELMYECVIIQRFIFEQCRMQANGYFARVNTKPSSSRKLIRTFFKPSHTQSL